MTKDQKVGRILGKTDVIAVGLDRARELITSKDDFIKNQSLFDRQARMRIPLEAQKVTEKDYLTFLKTQVRPWSKTDVSDLRQVFISIASKFKGLAFELPEQVYLVKTSGVEEAFSAYTRRHDVIVMPEDFLASMEKGGGKAFHPSPGMTKTENIYIHEFFHLFSKNNPSMRHRLYADIHYRQCRKSVTLPNVPWNGRPMPTMKLSNPDTPSLNVAIDLMPPDSDKPMPYLPVLLAKAPYASGLFFQDMEWVFLAIDEHSPNDWRVVLDKKGRPIILQADDKKVKAQYMRKIGRNITDELFHPDEVLAQNFVLAINQPSLQLLMAMDDVMRGKAL